MQATLNKNKFRKNCEENHYVKAMTPDMTPFSYLPAYVTYATILTHVHVRRFYGNCQTLCTIFFQRNLNRQTHALSQKYKTHPLF